MARWFSLNLRESGYDLYVYVSVALLLITFLTRRILPFIPAPSFLEVGPRFVGNLW
jgi:hypothetical protein